MTHRDRICTAAIQYGIVNRMDKTMEEMAELMVAMHHRKLDGEGGIIEEMADVRNMLDQLAFLLDAEEKVAEIAERKMVRTMERMSAERL